MAFRIYMLISTLFAEWIFYNIGWQTNNQYKNPLQFIMVNLHA